MMIDELDGGATRDLRAAGWYPERNIEIQGWIDYFQAEGVGCHDAGAYLLAKFGGVSLPFRGPGVTSVKSSIKFDPFECKFEEDRYLDWSSHLGRKIFPIGTIEDSRFFLGIDEYMEFYLLETWIGTFGKGGLGLSKMINGYAVEVISL